MLKPLLIISHFGVVKIPIYGRQEVAGLIMVHQRIIVTLQPAVIPVFQHRCR